MKKKLLILVLLFLGAALFAQVPVKLKVLSEMEPFFHINNSLIPVFRINGQPFLWLDVSGLGPALCAIDFEHNTYNIVKENVNIVYCQYDNQIALAYGGGRRRWVYYNTLTGFESSFPYVDIFDKYKLDTALVQYYQNGIIFTQSNSPPDYFMGDYIKSFNLRTGEYKEIPYPPSLEKSPSILYRISEDRMHIWSLSFGILRLPSFELVGKCNVVGGQIANGFLTNGLIYLPRTFLHNIPFVLDIMTIYGEKVTSFAIEMEDDQWAKPIVTILFSKELDKALLGFVGGGYVIADTTPIRQHLDELGLPFHPTKAVTNIKGRASLRQNANQQSISYWGFPPGTEVQVLDISGGKDTINGITDYWYKVKNPLKDKRDGWIFGGYLDFTEPAGQSASPSQGAVAKPGPPSVQAVNIYASSFLTEPFDKNMYQPVKAFDGKADTGWIEKVPGPGLGEYLGIELNKPLTIDRITLMPGWFDARYWRQNNRVKRITIQLDDFETTVDLKDKMVPQEVRFKQPVTFKRAKFTIRAVYPTSKWDDTALAEVEFYYKDQKIPLDISKFADQLKVVPEEE